jgi:hypothetical protein
MAESREPSEHGDLEWLPPSRLSKGRCSSTHQLTNDAECSPLDYLMISRKTTKSDASP